jgi:hypothetical protein
MHNFGSNNSPSPNTPQQQQVNAAASTCPAATTTAAPTTTVAIISLKGLVSCDFDGHFMTSSYSLDVRHILLYILFFNFRLSYLNFIIMIFSA